MTRHLLVALTVMVTSACASIPPSRYGVRSLRVRGMHAMDEDALRNCLSMAEREWVGATLGVRDAGDCGQPPFDVHHLRASFWVWPWTEWSLFDRVALGQDRHRIERWYQARGYHAARVTSVRVDPPQAERNDTLPPEDPAPGCERNGSDEGCPVDIEIRVEEGRPTHIAELRLLGLGALPAAERSRVRAALELRRGDRFDEALYDLGKQALQRALGDLGYARAVVTGVVRVDRPRRQAAVELTVEPGPKCVFGTVHVVGADRLPTAPIRAATLIERGDPYRADELVEAQAGVFDLGSFASVLVEPILPAQGNVVDVRVTVSPARRQRLGLGIGVQSGVIEAGQGMEQVSVPQWELHLSARYTHRDFLGGLRQLVLEERPRVIVQESFPGFDTPRLGNLVSAELRQPAFLEARTRGVLSASHDWGPDPFDTYYRHRIDSGAAVERFFFRRQRLLLSVGIRNNLTFVPSGETTATGEPAPASSVLTFYEQQARLDFRDAALKTHSGALFALTVQEAGYALPSSWRYLRLLPDARVYVPLPLRVTVAARVALGALLITHASPDLDPLSQQLGPHDYRLRGGGASSNRGFLPGRLGDGPEGGVRRWEASLELRVPVTGSFGTVLFIDAGDVSRLPRFRFDHPQTSVGLGLRYFTFVGALRVDFAWRVPGWQVLGTDLRDPGGRATDVSFGIFRFPGAVHITLGEAF